ncbi:type II secretion system protein [Tannockella kyphosi]|uniref:type II secretion system protein n=1 Tax=Tannockella kyphosi TaxID=2899121 RepID=UPI002013B4A8|nr:type II secretion system protein [Tannockella kyphosi]
MDSQRGSTLVENMVAVLILGILSAVLGTVLFAGMNLYQNTRDEELRVQDVYNAIQAKQLEEGVLEQKTGTISYVYNQQEIVLSGSYLYDVQEEKLFEFFKEQE